MGQGKDLACSMIPDEPALNFGWFGRCRESANRGQWPFIQDTHDEPGGGGVAAVLGYSLALRSIQSRRPERSGEGGRENPPHGPRISGAADT